MNKLYFITGASGAGKTTAIKNIELDKSDTVEFFFFDSVGVPSSEEMIEKFGNGEEWQRVTTHNWVKKIKDQVLTKKVAILDGQIRPSFIDEACKEQEINDYEVILFDCSNEERTKRLHERNQPELANQDMMNWANYLREESIKRGYTILDNTNFTQDETKQKLKEILGLAR
jgi:dephospho-CoA kinase